MRPHDFKLFTSRSHHHVLAVRGSRLYAIGPEDWRDLAEWQTSGEASPDLRPLLADLDGGHTPGLARLPAVRTLSLNLAQVCNMHCGYCYADHGKFGGSAATMALQTARQAV